MIAFHSANFDDFIPKWRTPKEDLSLNVLALVTKGSVHYTLNGQNLIAESGDLLFIPKHTERAGQNLEGTPHQKYTVLFYHSEEDEKEITFLGQPECLKIHTRHFDYLKHRLERLYEELRGQERFRSYICVGILQELLGMVSRELEQPEVTPMKLRYVQTLKNYLYTHYRESIDIEQLARLIHRSPNYTISIFKDVMETSPIKFMHHIRMMEACNLLCHSDMTVTSIAGYLGYYDAAYFSRTFKAIIGMSPRTYRQHDTPPL
ncbi:AraC family transcriptional regulator [Pullulanibacillus camelliae]|uniref:AraC family transcriptional regulator n=1 Tax=Pullulanibacillus camelliae TaxID=1707096 RepID=A0A8J2Y9Q2_9BACL|nr:AraC family transcriptional regulator [Pullulanibacillus camelliae]GGE26656.1 AraC family transcriptional regulator [Pullulanibacillus camelliae]